MVVKKKKRIHVQKFKKKQVAQLWQKDRAKLDTVAIKMQCYLQIHAQNCIKCHFMCASGVM